MVVVVLVTVVAEVAVTSVSVAEDAVPVVTVVAVVPVVSVTVVSVTEDTVFVTDEAVADVSVLVGTSGSGVVGATVTGLAVVVSGQLLHITGHPDETPERTQSPALKSEQ
jgi:hypothetical protein